jgi:hypothetical protein
MHHAHPVSRQGNTSNAHDARRLSAWTLAVLLVAIAGCSSVPKDSGAVAENKLAPTVSSTNPVSGANGMAIITATFSEPMNQSTITPSTFVVFGPDQAPVTGTVIYDAATGLARFTPSSPLAPNTAYTVKLTTGAMDATGTALESDHAWTFTTSSTISEQTSPELGAAGRFTVLAGSTITSTGETTLTGDVGVSPGSAVTGFPPATLTGASHAGDARAAAGMADLTKAYDDAAGRKLAPVIVAGNLGGLTLPPGLYKSTSSLSISSGDLTLDALGDPNAVFIFQIASTLTTTSGRAVILSGGAKSSNVFWQVGSSATLGTTSAFKGTIMADQSITLDTGAMLEGRALARIGAVTLAGNAIVSPSL